MIEVNAEETTLDEWITNTIKTINGLGAEQVEYTTTIENDSEKYVVKFLVTKIEEDNDDC